MSDTVSNNASPATEVTKEAGRVKLPFKEMVSYSFTDMAGNLLYVTLSSYIMYFYTDVFGISASGALGAATILLVARFADAISAVVWVRSSTIHARSGASAARGSCGSRSRSR